MILITLHAPKNGVKRKNIPLFQRAIIVIKCDKEGVISHLKSK